MKHSDIQKIIDLIITDNPSLKGREEEIKIILKKFKNLRPNIKPDKAFIESLRSQIQETEVPDQAQNAFLSLFLSFFTMKSVVHAGVGVLVGILVFPLWSYLGSETEVLQIAETPLIQKETEVMNEKVALEPVVNDEVLNYEEGNLKESGIGGFGGGGGGMLDSRMGMPYPGNSNTQFNFVFNGETPEAKEVQLVLKRESVSLGNKFFKTDIASDSSVIDLSPFENLEIENVSFIEDKPFGYSLYYNQYDGGVNIQKYWKQWPNPFKDCHTQACHEKLKLTESDIPKDSEMLTLAAQFLQNLKVDTSLYGNPVIDNEWRLNQGTELWIPDEISVLYPLKVEGKAVYQQWQGKSGLRVGVDIRNKKVASVSPIRSENFQSVRYAGVSQKVLEEMITSGGGVGEFPQPLDEKTEKPTVILGDPELVWIENYYYDQRTEENQQLLVPALRFPVQSVPEGYEVRRQDEGVMVPLVKGFTLQVPPIGIYKIGEQEPPNQIFPIPLEEPIPMMSE